MRRAHFTECSARRRARGPLRRHYLPPRPNFMKMSSLPLLRISPPGAVISENFCIRFAWEVGGGCTLGCRGCAVGAGTTAGPGRRAGDDIASAEPGPALTPVLPAPVPAAPAAPPSGPIPTSPLGPLDASVADAGDCTVLVGVPTLPAIVRAIVFDTWPLPATAPLGLACHIYKSSYAVFLR